MYVIHNVIKNLWLRRQIALAASVTVGLAIGSCLTALSTTTTRANIVGTQDTSNTKETQPPANGQSSGSSYDGNAVIASATPTATRNYFSWPFSEISAWNMPIGSGARYVPANIQQAYYFGANVVYIYKVNASDPVRQIYAPGGWASGRCTGTQSQGALRVSDSLIVPDATPEDAPTNASAFLLPDGRTLVQLNLLARCTRGGNVYGWRSEDVDIYRDGLRGGHGGSGLSSIGGTIRVGELTGSNPIRHALKINLWAQKYLNYSSSNQGFRWPAETANSYAATGYKGRNANLVMGSLLAIPSSVKESSLGLSTRAGRKLFHALQDYGAYIVDDSGWDSHALSVENGVLQQFRATYGYDFTATEGNFYDDVTKLFKALNIVSNNEPNNVGGGGTRRAALAPKVIGTRDKFLWPFSSRSPWNHPLGSGARYVPANLQQAYYAGVDEEYIYKIKASDSTVRRVYGPGNWGPGRCTGTLSQGTIPIPDDIVVADATENSTPNNPAAFLMPNGRTLVQLNPLARCSRGGNVYGWRSEDVDIYGDGLRGGHGGSGLSSIGGSIRLGELTGTSPIRHALKINIWGQKYLNYSPSNQGYRWPANRADSYAATEYGGKNPSLVMGSLLAIRPSVTESSLGLSTPAARKLFHALQDYGAYVVDDTYGDGHVLSVEKGVLEEYRAKYGYSFTGTSGTSYNDMMKLYKALYVVDNNAANNVGGGGKLRVPLAPPIGN